jgi:copper homeostasis protein
VYLPIEEAGIFSLNGKQSMVLEICVDSVESATAAAAGGAERIELCSALSEGGITPSAGLIAAVRAAVGIQLFTIIRPRGGNFVYSDRELDVMRRDILEAKARKVDGVVLGLLTPEDTVDVARTADLIRLARPLEVTFHRAFDLCPDIDRALEDVIASGADRLLTSGGKSDAVKGMNALAALQCKAGGLIRIMAGGGIRLSNVREIVSLTGVREIHTSLNTHGRNPVNKSASEIFQVREDDVRAFKSALEAIPAGG